MRLLPGTEGKQSGVRRYELKNAQWMRIEPLLPGGDNEAGDGDRRLFVNAVLWVLRSGACWEELPLRYGPWRDLLSRFKRWEAAGVWEKVFDVLVRDPDNEYLMLDRELVEAHRLAVASESRPAADSWRADTR